MGRHLNMAVLAAAGLMIGAGSASAAVNLGGVQDLGTLYSWHAGYEGIGGISSDVTTMTGFQYHNEENTDIAYLLADGSATSTVAWHFTTEAGTVLSSVIEIYAANYVWGNAGQGSYITGEWSTDNTNWNQFVHLENTDGANSSVDIGITTLNFGGGSDLYLRYTANRVGGGDWYGVQLLRSAVYGPEWEGFFIKGSIVAVPEAATLGLMGAALLPLMMRKRK